MYKGQVYKVKGQGQVLWLKTAIIISWIFHYFCKKTTGSHGLQVTRSLICISVILTSAAIFLFFRHLFTLQNSLIKCKTRILEKETPSTLSGYLLSKSTRLIIYQLLNFGLTHRPRCKNTCSHLPGYWFLAQTSADKCKQLIRPRPTANYRKQPRPTASDSLFLY